MSNYQRLLPENIEVGDVVLMPFFNDRIYPGIITEKKGNRLFYRTIDGGMGVSDSGEDIIVLKKRAQGGLELHVGDRVRTTFLPLFESLK